jgi:hypothetical protein
MAFLGNDSVRCTNIAENKCLQEVNNVKYLGCDNPYGNEHSTEQKVTKSSQLLVNLNKDFKLTWIHKF